MEQPPWKTVWRFLRKLSIELPYDPAIPLLGIYPDKTIIQKGTCTPMFIAELLRISKTWNQPKCPLTDEWIRKKKYTYVYIYIYYSSIKKNEIIALAATWMAIDIILSESQIKTNIISLICGI